MAKMTLKDKIDNPIFITSLKYTDRQVDRRTDPGNGNIPSAWKAKG